MCPSIHKNTFLFCHFGTFKLDSLCSPLLPPETALGKLLQVENTPQLGNISLRFEFSHKCLEVTAVHMSCFVLFLLLNKEGDQYPDLSCITYITYIHVAFSQTLLHNYDQMEPARLRVS